MEIVASVRNIKICRESRVTDFSNQGIWTYTVFYPNKSSFENSFGDDASILLYPQSTMNAN